MIPQNRPLDSLKTLYSLITMPLYRLYCSADLRTESLGAFVRPRLSALRRGGRVA